MSKVRRILQQTASNTAGYLVSVVVALLLSPYVVEQLGDVGFGIWTVITSLTGYYGLLDLGIRSALGHFLARYRAQEDPTAFRRTLATASWLMLIAAGAALLATIVLAVYVPTWYSDQIPSSEAGAVRTAIGVLGAGLACGFLRAVASTTLYACQHITVLSAIGIVERIVSAVLIVVALDRGAGLSGLALATTGTMLLAWAATAFAVRRLVPEARVSLRLASRSSARELLGYGGFSFLINAAERIVLYADALLISFFIALDAVTYYAHALNIVPYYIALIASVTWTLTPYATQFHVQGDRKALQEMLLRGTRLTLILTCVIGGGLVFTGTEFISLWMGAHFVFGEPYASSGAVLAILAAAMFFRATQSVGRQILFACREVRFLAYLSAGEMVFNVVISIALVGRYGLLGIAAGTLISMGLSQGLIQPLFTLRMLGVSLGEYIAGAGRVIFPMIVTMGLADRGVRLWLGSPETWTAFVVHAALIAAPSLIVGMFTGTSRTERLQLWRRLRGTASA